MKKKILSIKINKILDQDPDTSYLGKYSDKPDSPYSIDRFGENGEGRRGQYRYFNPNYQKYIGDNEELAKQYCWEDFERIESFNNGEWHYIGIVAVAEVASSSGTIQTIQTGGVWGIESDCDKDWLKGVGKDQLGELRKELEDFGFNDKDIENAINNLSVS
jgi:hypothetical protein